MIKLLVINQQIIKLIFNIVYIIKNKIIIWSTECVPSVWSIIYSKNHFFCRTHIIIIVIKEEKKKLINGVNIQETIHHTE